MEKIVYTEEIVTKALDKIQYQTMRKGDMYLRDIKEGSPAISITCPFHKQHREQHPSCGVFIQEYNGWHIGDYHCFTCGAHGTLTDLINECFNESGEFGEKWLEENIGELERTKDDLDDFDFPIKKEQETFLDEAVLEQYDYYHPYMWERKLTKEVVDKFRIGYDELNNALTFPVWDEKGRLKFITYRSVSTKRFLIPKNVEKPVYLLNYICKNNITQKVYVCESQLNTLTCYCYGQNAVGLFGTGTKHQIDVLNKSGINHFVLALDPDEAGINGTKKLIKGLKSKLVDVLILPPGKDVNDLSREEFYNCEMVDDLTWLKNNT